MPKFLGELSYIDKATSDEIILTNKYSDFVEFIFYGSSEFSIDFGNRIQGAELIDWGDGALSTTTKSHSYTRSSSDYRCRVYGNITTISGGNNVNVFGRGTMYYFEPLYKVKIPSSVTTIGENAFSACSSLKDIVIPESVTSVGNHAFSSCFGLKSVVLNCDPNVGSEPFNYVPNTTCYYYFGSSIDENSPWYGKLNSSPVYTNCTPVDLSKYTIVKTTDDQAQSSDGIILLITEAAQS